MPIQISSLLENVPKHTYSLVLFQSPLSLTERSLKYVQRIHLGIGIHDRVSLYSLYIFLPLKPTETEVDVVSWGNSQQEYRTDSSDNRNASQGYSAIDTYLGRHEFHEVAALSFGTSSKKKSIRKHKDRMMDHIKELNKKLPK